MSFLTIDTIRERSGQLDKEIAAIENKSEESNLIERITRLLDDVVGLSAQADSFDDYRWLGDMAVRWHAVLSTRFGESRPMVALARPRKPWVSPASSFLSEKEIEVWLRGWADLIKYASLSQDRDGGYYNFLAKVVFASEVLHGRINFAQRISPQSYKLLEGLWLKEAKLLAAYFESERKGMDFNHEAEDFFSACNHIRDMLDNQGIKAQASEFGVVKKYLLEHYVEVVNAENRVFYPMKGGPELEALIREKAYRIYETTGSTDAFTNWTQAETYVKMYYENIIPAVEEKDKERVLRVIKAFQYSKMNRFLIINCFETALAIYFLDADIIRSIWDDSAGKPIPDWTVEDVVYVDSWPKNFSLQEKCKARFWWCEQKIGFKGVMREVEKEALLTALKAATSEEPRPEHVKAIEDLYSQSRLVQKMTTL